MGILREHPRFEEHSPTGQLIIVVLVILILIGITVKLVNKH